jgi:uncharacterized protein
MDAITLLIGESAGKVWISLTHNWPYLLASVIIAALLKLFTDQEKISSFLVRNKNAGVVTATATAVGTPLCSCGTTAVVLGMMASMIPWAPIVAFMVASPLSSPEGIFYSAGLFGWPFAIYYFITSIILGLAGGALADFIDKRGWLANQTRMHTFSTSTGKSDALIINRLTPELAFAATAGCGCGSSALEDTETSPAMDYMQTDAGSCGCGSVSKAEKSVPSQATSTCGCDAREKVNGKEPVTVKRFFVELFDTTKTLLVMFVSFAFIGFFLNGLIPEAWISTIFGSGNFYSIPLAATLGLPFYISSEGSLPLISSLIQNGMDKGAAMAFLITGAGTSLGAVTGMLTIARWRVVGLVVGTLLIGSIIAGYGFNLMMAFL